LFNGITSASEPISFHRVPNRQGAKKYFKKKSGGNSNDGGGSALFFSAVDARVALKFMCGSSKLSVWPALRLHFAFVVKGG
jgi:hypothetical protein